MMIQPNSRLLQLILGASAPTIGTMVNNPRSLLSQNPAAAKAIRPLGGITADNGFTLSEEDLARQDAQDAANAGPGMSPDQRRAQIGLQKGAIAGGARIRKARDAAMDAKQEADANEAALSRTLRDQGLTPGEEGRTRAMLRQIDKGVDGPAASRYWDWTNLVGGPTIGNSREKRAGIVGQGGIGNSVERRAGIQGRRDDAFSQTYARSRKSLEVLDAARAEVAQQRLGAIQAQRNAEAVAQEEAQKSALGAEDANIKLEEKAAADAQKAKDRDRALLKEQRGAISQELAPLQKSAHQKALADMGKTEADFKAFTADQRAIYESKKKRHLGPKYQELKGRRDKLTTRLDARHYGQPIPLAKLMDALDDNETEYVNGLAEKYQMDPAEIAVEYAKEKGIRISDIKETPGASRP